jgi:protein TonB
MNYVKTKSLRNSWIVFENKNKEYRVYQLRQESAKTSLFALLWVYYYLLLISIPKIMSLLILKKNIVTLT